MTREQKATAVGARRPGGQMLDDDDSAVDVMNAWKGLIMGRTLTLCLLGLAVVPAVAEGKQARLPPLEELVYLSCSEAQAMEPPERVAVAGLLADSAAARYGIALPDEATPVRELGILVRAGCTMLPRALLFGVRAQAVRVEAERLSAER